MMVRKGKSFLDQMQTFKRTNAHHCANKMHTHKLTTKRGTCTKLTNQPTVSVHHKHKTKPRAGTDQRNARQRETWGTPIAGQIPQHSIQTPTTQNLWASFDVHLDQEVEVKSKKQAIKTLIESRCWKINALRSTQTRYEIPLGL